MVGTARVSDMGYYNTIQKEYKETLVSFSQQNIKLDKQSIYCFSLFMFKASFFHRRWADFLPLGLN